MFSPSRIERAKGVPALASHSLSKLKLQNRPSSYPHHAVASQLNYCETLSVPGRSFRARQFIHLLRLAIHYPTQPSPSAPEVFTRLRVPYPLL
jgi:hypothetical protein